MKKFAIVLSVILVLLIASVILLPILFKDDIREALDQTIDEHLDAKVYYDIDQFDLSLITNFPNLTVSMGDFGIVGINEFSEDTLASINKFQITVDLMSVIGGNQIEVEKILLDQPKIMALILENGKANYDIVRPDDQGVASEEETNEHGSPISINIEKWIVSNSEVVYKDQSMNFYVLLKNLYHEGIGDISLDVFDMNTTTSVEAVSLEYEGVEYVSDKAIKLDVILNMNLPDMKFTFKDNRISINNFVAGVQGYISMPEDDVEMDITFNGKDIDLTSILSLVPGVYQEYLDSVTVSGEINFDGYVKGTYNKTSMPKIGANLSVERGRIAHTGFDLPMEDINIKSNFYYPSADLSKTSFNVDDFSMSIGEETVAFYLKFRNLEDYTWDFGFDGNADLEKIMKIIPLAGITLRGKVNANLKTAGKMSDMEADRYDAIPTSGSLSIAQFYFESADDLPQGFGISKAHLTFDPKNITLAQFEATTGSSDFHLKGNINNHLGYVMGKDELLVGTLSLKSNLIDLNEFMSDSEEEEGSETIEETSSLEVIRVPKNIDLTFSSVIKQVRYTTLSIEDFQGKILIKDEKVILDKNRFTMLDSQFELTGTYVTKDLEKPKYDLAFHMRDFPIKKSFESFETVRQYVPIARHVDGKFSSKFSVNGFLGKDMMPLMDEINLLGSVKIDQASLDKGDFINKLNAITALKKGAFSSGTTATQKIMLNDAQIEVKIKDGMFSIKPFDLEVKGQKATVQGNNTLDGELHYSMLLKDIPTGAIGKTLNSALSSLIGSQKVADKIDLKLGIKGTYDRPEVKLLGMGPSGFSGGANTSATLKEELISIGKAKTEKFKEELTKKKAEAEAKAKEAIRAKAKLVQDSINAIIEAEKKKVEETAKDKLKSFFKKKGGGE